MEKYKLHDRLGIPHEEGIKTDWLLKLKTLKPGQPVDFGRFSYTAPVSTKYYRLFRSEVTQALNFRSVPNKTKVVKKKASK